MQSVYVLKPLQVRIASSVSRRAKNFTSHNQPMLDQDLFIVFEIQLAEGCRHSVMDSAIGVAVMEMAPGDTTVGSTPFCLSASKSQPRELGLVPTAQPAQIRLRLRHELTTHHGYQIGCLREIGLFHFDAGNNPVRRAKNARWCL